MLSLVFDIMILRRVRRTTSIGKMASGLTTAVRWWEPGIQQAVLLTRISSNLELIAKTTLPMDSVVTGGMYAKRCGAWTWMGTH